MRDRIDTDEDVVLFPTYGCRSPDAEGPWLVHVHGWIHEPEHGSPLREGIYRAMLATLGGLGVDPGEVDAAIPRRRLWPFLVDDERGERVAVRIGGALSDGAPAVSGPDGHFEASYALPDRDADAVVAAAPHAIALEAGPSVDGRRFGGTAHLIPPHGVSVITDIDDTIKVTEVRDRRAMLANSFARPFRAVPGMAELYRGWAARGVAIHYVSSSPYPLYAELEAFRVSEGFPAGPMLLKRVRLVDRSLFDLFRSGEITKPAQILPVLDAFPERRFVLVGDSGEHDPEVYGRIARDRPAQVLHVAIRDVSDEDPASDRMRLAFAGVERHRWTLFRDPAELRIALPA